MTESTCHPHARSAPPLTIDEFRALLDRLGSAIDRWPAPEAQAAADVLAASADARAELEQAQALERVFAADAHTTTPGLERRILARIGPRDRWIEIIDWITGALWRPAAIVAVPVLVGFSIGIGVAAGTEQSGLHEDLQWAALAAADNLVGLDESGRVLGTDE